MEKQYGYIRLTQFQEKTDGDFEKALRALEVETKGTLKGIILDLRNNPGGLLDQAVKIADRFLDSGLIVSVEGRKEEQKMKFYAHAQGTMPPYPVVVLINGGSASASEIVAGAIQDHKRGLLVGTQSFGKGSVQTIFPLKEGAGLRLTTARYFTPSGRSIQAKGIVPDIVVKPIKPEDEKDPSAPKPPAERDLDRHLIDVGTPPADKDKAKKEETKPKKPADNQLDIALDLLKSWNVFNRMPKAK
jgi:carboxyl-terminal processing protease